MASTAHLAGHTKAITLRYLLMKLCNYAPPYPDEWTISHFLRVLRLNALDFAFFESNVMGRWLPKKASFDYELKNEFSPFFRSLNTDIKIDDYFLSTSLFPFHSIFFSPKAQTRYKELVLNRAEDAGRKTSIRSLTKIVKICPVCMHQDQAKYGEAYYHRSHQLPGVLYCAKHHVKLLNFIGLATNLGNFDMNDFAPIVNDIPAASGIKYAEYAQELLVSGATSDLLTVKAIIQRDFDLRGYKADNLKSSLYKSISNWTHSSLFDVPAEQFSQWLHSMRSSQVQNILGLLMFLFPNPAKLIERLNMNGQMSFSAVQRRMIELVGDDYKLLGYDKGQEILTLRHSCGMEFDIAASSFFDGCRCEQCRTFPSYSEIKRALTECSNGKYKSPINIIARNKIPVLDVETKEISIYPKDRIIQELSRPTPSELFPELSTRHQFAHWHEYLRNYPDFLAWQNKRFRPAAPRLDAGIDMEKWCKAMRACRRKGKLSEERIQILSSAGFKW